jgi:hypothetical protein
MRIATALGGVGQFVAGMWSLLRGLTLGATLFGVALGRLCFVVLVLAVAFLSQNSGFSATSFAAAVALFYVAWALFEQGNSLVATTIGWAGMAWAVIAFVTAARVCSGDGDSRFLPFIAGWRLLAGAPAGVDTSSLAGSDHHRGLRH